ncbi:LA_3696 family protein [Rhodothermus marinus]|jgi:uncharacterized protein YicC (UPF0701 family)|uniref:LA_3696 family protein n=1 Tax=Rhodothermus marinus TaxID=29549 RepID=UPI0012BA3D80|nr:hypothetical protein [Rhodothermus marinus]BBM70638.1 hypothetical protein RmaAA213_24840 [Rhodothermus marinus]BBM73624.1 hypothetical protein RmaAA338_24890 [Rhodothermus marinus]
MAILTVPKVLREKLGDDGVEALIALLNEAAHHERDNLLGILEERFERRVTEEGARLDKRIAEEVARLEVLLAETEKRLDHRITEEVARLEVKLSTQMAGMRADLIRWMFIFWVGQLGTLLAILFAFFR